jgi:hypothetical protein
MAKLIKRIPSKVCPCCLERFFKKDDKYDGYWEKKTHCSPKCSVLKLPEEEYKQQKLQYILSKIITTESGCMEWQNNCYPNGYGRLTFFGKAQSVHRVVWKIIKGSIPKGFQVLHHCDNPPCCNIDHLFLGTNQDNMDDKVKKGRHSHKITEQNKQKIIRLIKKGLLYKNIAEEFDVHSVSISQIALQNGIRRRISSNSFQSR